MRKHLNTHQEVIDAFNEGHTLYWNPVGLDRDDEEIDGEEWDDDYPPTKKDCVFRSFWIEIPDERSCNL